MEGGPAGRSGGVFAAIVLAGGVAHAELSIQHAATVALPASAVDQHGSPFTITGVSGVTWLGGDAFAAVMDNSDKVVLFDLALAEDGTVGALTNLRGLTLDRSGDHEGIALAGPGEVLISNEANSRIRAFGLADGLWRRTIPAPEIYDTRRGNLGLESLAFDAAFIWSANEEALSVDGPRASPTGGTVVRLLRLDALMETPIAQYAYEVDAMHGPTIPFGPPGQSGLSDLVALPDGSVLALERSLAFIDPLFQTRIYEVETAGATDVSDLATLDGAVYTPTTKRLLYSGAHNNLEGLCLGPRLTPATHALVGVVDDGDPVSSNAVVVFLLGGLEACAFDADGSGTVDLDDLHFLHRNPADLNGDGATDATDRRCLEAYLRRHEAFDQTSRRPR